MSASSSYALALPSLPSPAEAIKSPFGEKRTAFTGDECRFNSDKKSMFTGRESTNFLL